MEKTRTRCVVADDHPAVISALTDFLVESGFEVVANAMDGPNALAAAKLHQPDLAVLDYRMPHTNGTELISKVAAASPGTRIVVYTGEATTVFAAEALEAGAHGVMLKEAPLVDLVRAFRAVLGGDYYVDPALLHPPTDRSGTLTERERAVLLLLAEGYEQKEIGRRLSIGAETVRTHAQKARRRLGASTSTQAVAEAIRSGLLE
ncbi:MAG: hypothetical protein QOF27_198 [Gaiellaceae bacterium]|jgi:DNA-binding NarL/FixJ family response regulator|nr:hypothetical protein [Gaiellaceae bacterium]